MDNNGHNCGHKHAAHSLAYNGLDQRLKRLALLVSGLFNLFYLLFASCKLMFMNSFAFTGVLSLITIWILNAIYLGITVFLADYCVSPNEYIKRFAEHKPAQNRNLT